MKIKGQLMDAEDMRNTFRRMAHQIVEQDGAEDLVLIGIRTRGVTVAKRQAPESVHRRRRGHRSSAGRVRHYSVPR